MELESATKRPRISTLDDLAAGTGIVVLVSSDKQSFRVPSSIAERSGFVLNILEGNTHNEGGVGQPVTVSLFHPSCKAAVLKKVIEYLAKHEESPEESDFWSLFRRMESSMLCEFALACDYLDIADLLKSSSDAIAYRIKYSKTAEETREKFKNVIVENSATPACTVQEMENQRRRVFHLVAVEMGLVRSLATLMKCFEAYTEWKLDSFVHIHADISSNGLNEYEILSSMTSLQTLEIQSRYFSPEIATTLARMTLLTSLDLSSYRDFVNASAVDCATALAAPLSIMTGLRSLNLRYGSFGPAGAVALAPSLRVMTRLHTLDLGCNDLRPEGATALVHALSMMTELQTLNLEFNNLENQGAKVLASSLCVLTGLQALNLESNSFDSQAATALAPSLRVMTALQKLNLSGNLVGPKGISALAASMSVMTDLRDLHLARMEFRAEGAKALAAPLSVMTHLRVLDLGRGIFGYDLEAVLLIADALSVMTGLHKLDLSSCVVGDEGATALAPSLSALTRLHTLTLDNNVIGSQGATALALPLVAMRELKILSLVHNIIDDEGATALAFAFSVMTELESLDLGNNSIEDEGATSLALSLGGLTRLDTLIMHRNDFGAEGTAAFRMCEHVNALVLDLSRFADGESEDY